MDMLFRTFGLNYFMVMMLVWTYSLSWWNHLPLCFGSKFGI